LTVTRREPRAALEVDLEVSGIRLSTFVTHLGLRAGERGRQIDCLLGILERVPRAAVALLGDVTEWNPYSRALRRLSERFGRHPAYPTFPAVRPLLALDRIWFSPREHLVEVRTQQTAVSRKASDHLPLVATIAIGERT
ncbi:MAG: endonuclease/exonuclease/phosphatase family protein, partial [Vicinamibacteria bacterium]